MGRARGQRTHTPTVHRRFWQNVVQACRNVCLPSTKSSIEPLEQRMLLAAVSWDGGGDGSAWTDPLNWSNNALPTSSDDVTIQVPGADPVIRIASGNHSVRSLVSDETITLSLGSLSLATTAQVNKPLTLTGGSLVGGTWSGAGGIAITASNGTLNGVTLNTNTTVGAVHANVVHGLTVMGTLTLEGDYASLDFVDSQTLGGAGQIVMTGRSAQLVERKASDAEGRLTIAPELTIIMRKSGMVRAYYGQNSVLNLGTIVADGAEAEALISGAHINQGRLVARNGGTVNIVDATTFAGAGTFDSTDGTVKVTGTLDNMGRTLALTAATGSLVLDEYGAIVGGQITCADGAQLLSPNGTLDGVTLASDMTLQNSDTLTVTHGLQLNATLTMNSSSVSSARVYFAGTQTLSGTGRIVVSGSATARQTSLVVKPVGDTTRVTFGPGLTIVAQHDAVLDTFGGQETWLNQGTLRADGATLKLNGKSWANQGRLEACNGGTLELAGTFTTAGLGTFDGRGGTIEVVGVMENVEAALALTATTGSLTLGASATAAIHGGRITTSGGARLLVNRGKLDGVTLEGEAIVTGTIAELSVANGLTLNGTLTLDGGAGTAWALFLGAQTLSGAGQVVMAGHLSTLDLRGTNGVATELTLGPDITIQARQNGLIRGYYNLDQVLVYGTIEVGSGVTLSARQRVSFVLPSQNALTIQQGGVVELGSDLAGTTVNASQFRPDGTLLLGNWTTPDTPQRLEVMGQDVGAVSAGLKNNFAYGKVELPLGARVQLVDESDNAPGTAPEALYVQSLVVATTAILDLNGLRVYARTADIRGQIVGGTVIVIPDSGPIAANTLTAGAISAIGEVDQWSFYGRAGRYATVVVNPSAGASSNLLYAQVQLLDAQQNVLASGIGSNSVASLTAIELPADGVYSVRVQAAASQPNRTGNYTITIWDTTPDAASLVLNQQHAGRIETPYSVDRWTFSASAGQQVRLDLVNAAGAGMVFDLDGPDGWSGFSDLASDSALVNLPASGTYVLTAHGIGGAYNFAYAFRLDATVQADLTLGVPHAGTLAGPGDAQLFRIDLPATTSLRLALDTALATDHIEFYAKFGAPPTRGDYQYGSTTGADQDLLIRWATAGTWYVLVYANNVRPPSPYVLTASAADVQLTSVSPDHLGNGQAMTLTLRGAGFDALSTVQLISGAAAYTAASVVLDSFTQLSATFAAGSVPAGQYAIHVTRSGGATATLPDTFTVSAGGEANLALNLVLPSRLGYHARDTIYVEYANTGTLAMPAPLLVLDVTQNGRHGARFTLDANLANKVIWTTAHVEGFSDNLKFLATGSTPGLLLPGESVRVPVYWSGWEGMWDTSYPPFQFRLEPIHADNTQALDWATLRDELRPGSIGAEAWNALYSNLITQIGGTWGGYVRMLDENAAYLARLGSSVTDATELYRFELRQANGFAFSEPLNDVVDALIDAPGVDLSFARSFPLSITGRYRSGLLGRGWYSPWETSLTKTSDGSVVIHNPDGSDRIFKPDARGGYLAIGIGQPSQLEDRHPSGYLLRQSDGTHSAFRADGKLEYIEDTNGNRITCAYTGELLTSLTHSSGRSLTLAYNPAGRLTSLTDSFGRQTLYSYDDANQHLLSVTDIRGRVTSYQYVTGQGAAAEHALAEIEQPGDTHLFFAYDPQGRITRTWRDGDAEAIAYSYDSAGTVTITDALGSPSRVYFDNRAIPLKLEDNLGNSVRLGFDAQANLISLTDAAGRPVSYSYDGKGNALSITNELGHTTRFTYSTLFNRMASAADANGQQTSFAYDSRGNLIRQTWADGAQETWTYNAAGLPEQKINARGVAIQYTYDTDGRITGKTYADNSHVGYEYDAHGNLTSTTDASGITTYTYDDLDQLVRIDYPGGRWLAFTYDAAGRRASSDDQTGHRLTYQYDIAGRFVGLLDGAGATIVHYGFDAAGQLVRQDLGNGLYTIWQYDAAGNLLHLTNHAADASVLSQYDYTYDVTGRSTSMTTLAGQWNYQYDDAGQLTAALFTSTNPEFSNQDLRYVYDPAGNRTQIIVNGATTAYSTNALNQYTLSGQTTYAYDSDGNLIQETSPAGVTDYGYDDENRLISVSSPQGLWLFTYDALGHLVSSTKDGVRTDFVIDPTDLGNRVAEYSAAGELLRHYVYATGLIRMTQGPAAFYYTADGLGSTSEFTSEDGAASNAYAYAPFGAVLSSTGTLDNPFQWIGGSGVAQAGDLSYMRARFYSPTLGRFLSRDPLGLAGGGSNLYAYAENNPIDRLDPAGTTYQCRRRAGDSFIDPYDPAAEAERKRREWDSSMKDFSDAWAMTNWGLSLVSPAIRQLNWAWNFATHSTGSVDPNEKAGPAGYGPQHFVQAGALLPYRVDFENDAAATAPAQFVSITDQLDPNIDWETFAFTQFGFGDWMMDAPSGAQHFETIVPVNVDGRSFEVHVRGDFDPVLGKVRVQFMSIDPVTGLPPTGVTGFLLPEDGTGRGQGYFTYVARAKSSLSTGQQIRNIAVIQFDLGETIATNQVAPHDPSQGTDPAKECLNTIDAGTPTSGVIALPATTARAQFTVTWSGSDEIDGSGIANYDVYVSDNDGAYVLWLDHTADTSATFTGVAGHRYRFYSIARDNVNHLEAVPEQADAQISVLEPGSLTGRLFNDRNGNGKPNAGETALANWTVFLDADRDGQLDPGEISTTTNAAGNYTFANLEAGVYRVSYVLPAGWLRINPATSSVNQTVTAGQATAVPAFAAAQGCTLRGSVFNDLSGEGTWGRKEPILAGCRVFLDSNRNGQYDRNERWTTTDPKGQFVFTNLPPGSYRVAALPLQGYRVSSLPSGSQDMTLLGGQVLTAKSFGQSQRPLISGNVFYDANRNGKRDAKEKALSGWRVYIDSDNDGVWDKGEASVLTDKLGNYVFNTLPIARHIIRAATPKGYRVISPKTICRALSTKAGQTLGQMDFGISQ